MIIVTEAFYSALKGTIFYSFMLTRKLTEQLRIFHNYLYSIFGYNKNLDNLDNIFLLIQVN